MKENFSIGPKEFLPKISADIDQRFPIASFFLLLMLFLKFGLKVPLPDILFYLVSWILLTSIPISFFFERFKAKKTELAINLYSLFLLFDLVLLTAIIYLVGAITWVIAGIYLFYTVTVFWTLPSKKAIFVTGWTNFLLVFLVLLQYLGILGQPQIFTPQERDPQNFPYLLTTITAVLAILGFLGYSADSFYQLLARKIKELKKTEEELTATRKFLEKEIKERTEELGKEKEKLEKEVRVKTKELEERKKLLENKVFELEEFYKMAVARELEIARLKEEIAKFKEK